MRELQAALLETLADEACGGRMLEALLEVADGWCAALGLQVCS